MPGQRAPWWMFAVAASFLAYITLGTYQAFWGPFQTLGLKLKFSAGGTVLVAVSPGSAAEQAGLQPSDVVLAVNGQPVHNMQDWQAILANTEVGRPERLEVLRGESQLQVTWKLGRRSWSEWRSSDGLSELAYFGVMFISLILGLVIAFRRPYDPVARVGAWLIATASIALGVTAGWAATWRHLPALIGALLWIPQVSRFVVDGIFLTFFTIFPARLFRARWPWVLLWIPALVPLPWRISALYAVVYQPGQATGAPEWVFSTSISRAAVYLVGGLAALLVNYHRLADTNQRRRVRVLLVGALVGSLATIGFSVIHSARVAPGFWPPVVLTVLLFFSLAFPLSFAYAILRHRLFDIRVMIRQGLQYTLARGVLLSVIPSLALLLLLDLLLHSDEPLAAVLRARGWVYAALGGVALAAHARRQEWLTALDRRFFRERYDAQRFLREVAEEVREARSLERVAPRVVGRIEAALHPEFAALLVRGPGEVGYHSVAAAPSAHAPPPLPAESKLLALVRLLGKPLEVSLTEAGWLKQQLPHAEADFLHQARIDLVVPISAAPGRTEAVLALGIKRSEEPYSREDQDLLVAIAVDLALLLDRPVAASARPSEAFEECPQCGTCYDTGAGRCASEGASLAPVRLPRTLVGRYRLERRRGRGGMGVVYEATDTALERHVAVKVIRDDLVGSAEAAERFRGEARAAASFTHPNVVTVHDFGVAVGTRAFLVMELLDGTTLREELRRQKRLPAPRAVEILRGVCAALEAAHRRQLVHRDLKPENIFLVRSETVEIPKVLDFGIAKFLPAAATQATRDTGPGELLGTFLYMAPEQMRGLKVDAKWDLWALAVVAYEMLAGGQPFAGATMAECHNAVLMGRFTPLSHYLPQTPARWEEFFQRAFAQEPVQRPNSARIFFSELERRLT